VSELLDDQAEFRSLRQQQYNVLNDGGDTSLRYDNYFVFGTHPALKGEEIACSRLGVV